MATKATPAKDVWMYVDAATQQQRGPLPETIVKRLIRKGLLTPQQFIWTKRLKEWEPLAAVEPFTSYCSVWFSYWYYMPEMGSAQQGPLVTKDLIALFLDGEIDGLTLVWTKEMTEWKPIGEVPALKDFLREATEDQDRESEALETQDRVHAEDQVFEEESVNAFVAEDGKEYVFDEETKKWVTPQQKIQEDLEALQEAADDDKDPRNGKPHKFLKPRALPKAPPLPPVASAAVVAPETGVTGVTTTQSSEEIALQLEALGADVSKASEVVIGDAASAEADAAAQEKKRKKKKKKSDKWKRAKVNTWVYVNGLPLDVTIQEVHDHFAKCGVIQTDLLTEVPRIKLYTNKEYGGLNGDASVCYMKDASVELAVQLLDKSPIRPDWIIDVSPAVFQQKGDEFVKHKKQRLDSRAKVKRIEQEKALSWNEGEDGDRAGLRIVVVKHMFTPEEIEDDAYAQELREEIEAECAKIGEVTKVTLFAKHVEGVVVIKFASGGSAAKCVDVMNGRFFGGHKLDCHFWDGTDYTHRESKHEEEKRTEQFDDWLNEGSSSSDEEDGDDDDKEPDTNSGGASDGGGGVHPGRVGNDTVDAAGGSIHAGRVLPDLDDLDDGDDDSE